MDPSDQRQDSDQQQPARRPTSLWPGLLAALLGVGAAWAAHELLPQVGVLTWAVLLGAIVANVRLLPATARPGLKIGLKKLLRIGIVLLGFSLPLAAIAALGLPVIALVVVTLLATLLATFWLGMRLRLGRPRSLLIATGFAICGASAIAAMEENAEADEDEVAAAIAMVTICGTVAMIAVPLLQGPLGLDDHQLGVWAGASVHEVGQVVAAASPAGAAAVGVAVVVKLTRVLMLAPVVAGVSILRRRRASRPGGGDTGSGAHPPIVPLFIVGFLACVLVRSAGLVPEALLEPIAVAQTLTLGAALFALGTGVDLVALVRRGGRPLLLGTISTLVVGSVSLAGVLALA